MREGGKVKTLVAAGLVLGSGQTPGRAWTSPLPVPSLYRPAPRPGWVALALGPGPGAAYPAWSGGRAGRENRHRGGVKCGTEKQKKARNGSE